MVKAVDANVVLRLLVEDDPRQTAIAEVVFASPVLVTLTVLLETAWVLRSRYQLSRAEIAEVLGDLVDRSTVIVEALDQVRWALKRYAERGDIADLIHVVAGRSASMFATFDNDIAKAAGDNPPVPIETLA